jgi:RNA-binding protein
LNPAPSKKELMNRSLSTITINIGKSGVNPGVLDEIKRHLKEREVVKLRFSKGISPEKQNYITQITEKSNAKLVDFRGNVAVIFKKRGN